MKKNMVFCVASHTARKLHPTSRGNPSLDPLGFPWALIKVAFSRFWAPRRCYAQPVLCLLTFGPAGRRQFSRLWVPRR